MKALVIGGSGPTGPYVLSGLRYPQIYGPHRDQALIKQ